MLALIYVAAICAANLSVSYFGPASIPINSFFLIGLDLALRNRLALSLNRVQMAGLIIASGLISYALNPASGMIAVASVVAFCVAALFDWATYSAIRGSWLQKCLGGVTAGAIVDSFVFPTIAFGGFLPLIVAMQIAAKIAGGAMWAWLFNRKLARTAELE